jgi:hypothetical protein
VYMKGIIKRGTADEKHYLNTKFADIRAQMNGLMLLNELPSSNWICFYDKIFLFKHARYRRP